MESFIFAHSRSQIPIWGYRFGHSGPKILFIGGVHGNEPEGVVLANGLLERFSQNFPYKIQLTLSPAFNIDGILKAKRKNGADVDLNRNLPTSDWTATFSEEKYFPGTEAASEPENKALVQFIQKEGLKSDDSTLAKDLPLLLARKCQFPLKTAEDSLKGQSYFTHIIDKVCMIRLAEQIEGLL